MAGAGRVPSPVALCVSGLWPHSSLRRLGAHFRNASESWCRLTRPRVTLSEFVQTLIAPLNVPHDPLPGRPSAFSEDACGVARCKQRAPQPAAPPRHWPGPCAESGRRACDHSLRVANVVQL